ncbi:hypothetical protein V6N13_129690 [Hibiscus sabdariffa]
MDELKWVHAKDEVYSAKKFCELESSLVLTQDKIWKLVWMGLVPPKVECFLWKVLLELVSTFVELNKRGIQGILSTLCVFALGRKKRLTISSVLVILAGKFG